MAAGLAGLAALALGCEDDRAPGSAGTPTATQTAVGNSGGGGTGGSGGGGTGGSGGGGTGGVGGTSAEDCFDGIDNDGDDAVDCLDVADCQTDCEADPCTVVQTLTDPAEGITGSTTGHAFLAESSCAAGSGSNPTVVYQVESATTGKLEVVLDSLAVDLNLSTRTACSEPGTETGCSERCAGLSEPFTEFVSVDVSQGEQVFVIVQGYSYSEHGPYTLDVHSRTVTCGDSVRDPPGEQCDDGDTEPGDGCDGSCQVESSESADNDDRSTAEPYTEPHGEGEYGLIDPADDEDWYEITVSQAGSDIYAMIFDFGGGACARYELDSYLMLFDDSGSLDPIAEDGSSGNGFCSQLEYTGVPPGSGAPAGTYYIRVSAPPYLPRTFAYRLKVVIVPP